MRVRYNDFEDYELDDARAMRRMMHQRQREGLRLANKRKKLRGPRDHDDWDDVDDYEDFEDYDYEDYDEDEFDQHAYMS